MKKLPIAMVVAIAVAFGQYSGAQEQDGTARRATNDKWPASWRPTVVSKNGMVTAGYPLAAAAGLKILQAGGNAMDAAIATWGMQGVVESPVNFDDIKRWRTAIEAGQVVGPRIVAAGPQLDGEGLPVASSRIVRTSEDARKTVDDLAAAGVDFIKVHGGLDRPRLLAIAAESRARGLRFAGHVPDDVTPSDAARMGIHSIEHFSGFSRPCSDELKRLLEPSALEEH
jgi:hypothetical protein